MPRKHRSKRKRQRRRTRRRIKTGAKVGGAILAALLAAQSVRRGRGGPRVPHGRRIAPQYTPVD